MGEGQCGLRRRKETTYQVKAICASQDATISLAVDADVSLQVLFIWPSLGG